jgi:hypothetical protein
LLGNNNLSTSKAKVNNSSVCAKSAKPNTSLFDSLDAIVKLITLAPPFSPNRGHNVNDFTKTSLRLWLIELGALTSNFIPLYNLSLYLLSNFLYNYINIKGFYIC